MRGSWYPIQHGELNLTPIALIKDGRVEKIISAKDLEPGQIGYLAIDLPDGPPSPITLEQALGAADIAFC